MIRRLAALLLVAIAVPVGLTGCENLPRQPVALRQVDGVIEVMICRDVHAESVWVDVRGPATGGEWVTITRQEGAALLSEGTIVAQGRVPDGLTEIESSKLRSSDAEEVDAQVLGDEYSALGYFGAVPWDELGDDWFLTDGSISEEPCP